MGGFMVGPASVAATIVTVNDNLVTHIEGGDSVVCGGDADLTENIGTNWRVAGDDTLETSGTVTGTCSSGPTWVVGTTSDEFTDRTNFDYSLRANSAARTSCSGSSVCGARAFHFTMAPITNVWGNVVADGVMPVNFCNLADTSQCVDIDGDGIIGLHDNCDLKYNPAQTTASACD